MASISKLILPNNEERTFKAVGLIPLQSKEYTGVVAQANTDPGGYLYFGFARPDDYNTLWYIKYRMYIDIPYFSDNKGSQYSEVEIYGYRSTYQAYRTWNQIVNTSYRPIYNHLLYSVTSDGYESGYGHLLGVRLHSSYTPASSTYSRTFKIDILECHNCTFEFADSMFLYANAPGSGSTNYESRALFDAITNGNTMSGDRNDISDINPSARFKTGSTVGIWAYSLVMEAEDGTLQNIATAADGTATSSNRTTGTTKKANTNGFIVGGKIFYVTVSYNPNTNVSVNVYTSYTIIDTRYTFNTQLTDNFLTPYEPIYLVGEIGSDGLYYLDQEQWWTQTPNDPYKVYVFIGNVFDSTTTYCRMNLWHDNYWLRYNSDTGNLEEISVVTKRLEEKVDIIGSNAVSVDITDFYFESTSAFTYYKIGTEGITLTPGLWIVYAMISDRITAASSCHRIVLGPTATGTYPAKLRMSTKTNDTNTGFYEKTVPILVESTETYYVWLSDTVANHKGYIDVQLEAYRLK